MFLTGATTQLIIEAVGPEIWTQFWVELAERLVVAEKAWKERDLALLTSSRWQTLHAIAEANEGGQVKGAAGKEWAHAKLAPVLPDWSEPRLFAWVDRVIDEKLAAINKALGQDWVDKLEDLEHATALLVEPILHVDLDGDGNIGDKPISGGLKNSLGLVLFLTLVGSACAERRPLVEHYRPPGSPPPAVNAPRPRSEDIRRVASSHEGEYQIQTWGGMQRNRNASLDMGVGLVACLGDWRAGGQLAKDRAGFCAGRENFGLNVLKDTTVSGLGNGWQLGAYVAFSP